MVRLVKTAKSKPMTCSIGDGANDVSMIQEAHVGLGIFGKEGRNAALAADFSFAKFKFTKRILLAHGYIYYTRGASLVQYFFYKNLCFVVCQFYYAFFNAFSVAPLYESVVLTLYNVFLTSMPVLLYGLFEQKVALDKIELNPYLYASIRNNKLLAKREFLRWNLQGNGSTTAAFHVHPQIGNRGIIKWKKSDLTLIEINVICEVLFYFINIVIIDKII